MFHWTLERKYQSLPPPPLSSETKTHGIGAITIRFSSVVFFPPQPLPLGPALGPLLAVSSFRPPSWLAVARAEGAFEEVFVCSFETSTW